MAAINVLTETLWSRLSRRERPTAFRRAAEAVFHHEQLIGRLLVAGGDAVLTFGPDGRVLSSNDAAEELLGMPGSRIRGAGLADLLCPERAIDVCALAGAGGACEVRTRRHDGRVIEIEAAFSGDHVGGQWLGLAVLRDITPRKVHEAELERRALHAPLTGLPNSSLLNNRIDLALSLARRRNQSMALLLLDLDRFKDVNDTLGHQAGDRLLLQIGPRLRSPLRETDTVARLGGDEFAVLLPPPTDLATACRVAARIVEALRQPFVVDTLTLEVGVSIGVALCPEHADRPSLLRAADIAMYDAKRNHLGFVVYSAACDISHVRELTLTGELRRAIEAGALSLDLQPKAEVGTGHVIGVEALVRWHHSRYGSILPEAFIRSAEQTGLVSQLTRWSLSTALDRLESLRRRGHLFTMAVDLPGKALQDRDLPDILRSLIESRDVPPELFILEITEKALMADLGASENVLRRIAALGCRLSLDHFGSGYSSLAYLQRLPINELKIDRSFVAGLTADPQAAAVAHSVIRLAKALDLGVVAEGVESEDVAVRLRSLACDQMQGRFIGPPMDQDRLLEWLQTAQAQRSSSLEPRHSGVR